MKSENVNINLDASRDKILNLEETKTTKLGNSYYLNIRGALRDAASWAESGHILVTEQFSLGFLFDKETVPINVESPLSGQTTTVSVSLDSSKILVSRQVGNDVTPCLEICKKTGAIVSIMSPKGTNLLAPNQSMLPQYTRATTDNDRGGSERVLSFLYPGSGLEKLLAKVHGYSTFSYQFRWNMVGLDPSKPPHVECHDTTIQDCPEESNNKQHVTIKATLSISQNDDKKTELIRQTLIYQVFANGRIRVSTHVMPRPALKDCLTLPRVGMSLALDPSLYNIQYFGRGSAENYADRKAGAPMGVYHTTPKDTAYHYIFPSENGNRSDCEWLALRNAQGEGICFATAHPSKTTSTKPNNSTFHFSAQLHSTQELHEATHTCDLAHRENGKHPVFVNLDHQLMGVGGDVSWMPVVYDPYLVPSTQDYQYDVWILPLCVGDDPALMARENNQLI